MSNGKQSGVSLLDSLLIMLTACTLTIFLVWLAGQIGGVQTIVQLPDFIVKGYTALWSFLTGAGLSVVLAILRKQDGDRPNFLAWILGTTTVLIVLVFGTAFTVRTFTVSPWPNRLATARFWFDMGPGAPPNLSFQQLYPDLLEKELIAPGADGVYRYHALFEWPEGRGPVEIAAGPAVTTASQTSAPENPQICFAKNAVLPTNSPPFEVRLRCTQGQGCNFASDDPGWAVLAKCPGPPARTAALSSLFSLIPAVYAEESKDSAIKPGWKVPSLATLQQTPAGQRPGYTQFTVTGDSVSPLKDSDAFRYRIFANGSPLYVDGWPPEDMIQKFDPAKGLDFSFGIENLDFSGNNQGCENITVSLEFLNRRQTVREERLTRQYAALRDAIPVEVHTADGMRIAWTGKYIKPGSEDRAELFVLSTPNQAEASRTRLRIDQSHLSFLNMDVVGVLRPPLNSPAYGVVLGLRQPTGQVRFTFDLGTARNLLNWLTEARASHPGVFPRAPFLYSMRPGDSGAGTMASCGSGTGL